MLLECVFQSLLTRTVELSTTQQYRNTIIHSFCLFEAAFNPFLSRNKEDFGVTAKGDFLGQRDLFNTQYPQVINIEV